MQIQKKKKTAAALNNIGLKQSPHTGSGCVLGFYVESVRVCVSSSSGLTPNPCVCVCLSVLRLSGNLSWEDSCLLLGPNPRLGIQFHAKFEQPKTHHTTLAETRGGTQMKNGLESKHL